MKIYIILLLCISQLSAQTKPAPDQPIVSCKLKGQLGNQMFQVATTLAYAWDYDAWATFPDLNGPAKHVIFNRDNIFFRLNTDSSPWSLTKSFKEIHPHSTEKIPFSPKQSLDGYFEFYGHFHHHRDQLLKVFEPKPPIINNLKNKYANILNHPHTVGVHVRTFNKEQHERVGHVFVGLDYYKNALEQFSDDCLFVIFSDRINWCKVHFQQFNRNMIFIEGNDNVTDLFLMSMMKHNIISNSTFSWWAAYLNQNQGIVVAPKYWRLRPSFIWLEDQPHFLILPKWIVIGYDPHLPYPEDMNKYDKRSQSVDTQ